MAVLLLAGCSIKLPVAGCEKKISPAGSTATAWVCVKPVTTVVCETVDTAGGVYVWALAVIAALIPSPSASKESFAVIFCPMIFLTISLSALECKLQRHLDDTPTFFNVRAAEPRCWSGQRRVRKRSARVQIAEVQLNLRRERRGETLQRMIDKVECSKPELQVSPRGQRHIAHQGQVGVEERRPVNVRILKLPVLSDLRQLETVRIDEVLAVIRVVEGGGAGQLRHQRHIRRSQERLVIDIELYWIGGVTELAGQIEVGIVGRLRVGPALNAGNAGDGPVVQDVH